MEKLLPLTYKNEIDREKPYSADTFRQLAVEKLQYLYQIRDLMQSQNYKVNKRRFLYKLTKYLKKIELLFEKIGEYEQREIERIMCDITLDDAQKSQQREQLFRDINEKNAKIYESPQYIKALEEYRQFLFDNKLMYDSTMYKLRRTTPKILPFCDLGKTFSGEESEAVMLEMPSDSIFDVIKDQEEYVESGYLKDYQNAVAEDKRQKQLTLMQLDYLFNECDTVCLHAEKDYVIGDKTETRFAEIIQSAYKQENVENRGMQVLRIYFKPTAELKEYLQSFIRFDRYHYDASEKFAPYVSFADILFLKDGKHLLDCVTHEGYFDVHESIKDVFDKFEKSVSAEE